MKVRKKFVFLESTEMKRILTVLDLTLLGIGSMLGMGVYIMSGTLAKTVGPAMFISFILAGITSILSAFCYAEFAARAPGTGSAYAYCYITIGEFVAFLLGWTLLSEYVIGTACLARGMSGYINSLVDHKISRTLRHYMPMDINFFSKHPDFLAFGIMLLFSGIISLGVRESSVVNNIVVAINMITITIIVIVGIIYAKISNWTIAPSSISSDFEAGDGGFAPFGGGKILEGAAICFYAYTGFDTVTTTGNEAKNPSKAIPLGLVFSLIVASIVYTSISCTFTLMWPYYDQDTAAPYPHILEGIGLPSLKWIITIGAIAAISGSALASVFGMARIIYTIAYDGLLFSFLGKINKRTKTPVNACMIVGTFTGLIAIIFDADQLINMTSLGTLMAYTIVAMCILILRYEPVFDEDDPQPSRQRTQSSQSSRNIRYISNISLKSILDRANEEHANIVSFSIALPCIILFTVSTFGLNICLAIFDGELFAGDFAVVIPASILLSVMLVTFAILQRQPTQYANLLVKVRPVPLVPMMSIFINTHLMLRLEWETWVRFCVWLVLGLVIYFWYGVDHSTERPAKQT